MKRQILSIFATLICFALPAYGQDKSSQRPQRDKPADTGLVTRPLPGPLLIGAGLLGFGYDNTVVFSRRTEKLPKGWGDTYVPQLIPALDSATGRSNAGSDTDIALALFLPLVEELWVNDELKADRIQPLVIQRLKALRPEIVEEWSRQLDRFGKGGGNRPYGAERPEAAGYLIQIDRLFASNGLNTSEAKVLLVRLGGLDADTVSTLTKALEANRKRSVRTQQAAVLLIQEDALFAGEALDRKSFQMAIEALGRQPAK